MVTRSATQLSKRSKFENLMSKKVLFCCFNCENTALMYWIFNNFSHRFLLFIKLFFVMGLIWVLELVSYFVFGRGSTHPVAVVLDLINILQPVAIFIIFVC